MAPHAAKLEAGPQFCLVCVVKQPAESGADSFSLPLSLSLSLSPLSALSLERPLESATSLRHLDWIGLAPSLLAAAIQLESI